MIILIEKNEETQSKILTEEKDNGKKIAKYVIEGVFIQSNVKNKNGRVYPKDVVKREVDRYIKEMVSTNRAVGELNHPATDPQINYERVSHKFETLKESGDNWVGRAVITRGTPMGQIVAGLMEDGVQMGVSTRAVGSTKLCEGGVRVVQNDFHLITAGDIVADPSAPDAFVQNLMEGTEWVWENGLLVEKTLEETRDEINKAAKEKKLDEAKLIEIFRKIIEGNSKA